MRFRDGLLDGLLDGNGLLGRENENDSGIIPENSRSEAPEDDLEVHLTRVLDGDLLGIDVPWSYGFLYK